MADTRDMRQQKAPSHYTRLQGRRGNVEVKSDKSLIVIRDQQFYEGNTTVFEKMQGFQVKSIDVPSACRQTGHNQTAVKKAPAASENPKVEQTNEKEDVIMNDRSAAIKKSDNLQIGVQEENSAQETFASNNAIECQSAKPATKQDVIQEQLRINQEKLITTIQGDYMQYANAKLEIPAKLFKYPKVFFPGTNKVVPDFYIKYVEPTNHEVQNTVEKCWSFKDKMYECTQQKIMELKEAEINISPNDFEWVIDHFEKSAINDKRQGVRDLIKSFRDEAKGPDTDIQLRVSDKIMEKVYNIWKNQRENRKNRSFIRYFWHYQDSVGEDNYQTFQINQMKNKTSLRGSIKQKMNGYAGAFIERENAVILSDMISHIHQKTLLQLDVYKIQDDQFDRLLKLDKQSSEEGSTQAVSLLDENDEQDTYKLPFLTKGEEKELIEHDQQCGLHTQSLFMSKDKYQQNSLQPCVEPHRDIHPSLFIYPQFPPPDMQLKHKGNKLSKNQQMQRGVALNNMYEYEFMELDPQSHQASLNAQDKAIKQAEQEKKNLKKQNNDESSAQIKDNMSRTHSARGANENSSENDSEHNEEVKSKQAAEKPKKTRKKDKNNKGDIEVDHSGNEEVSAQPEQEENKTDKRVVEANDQVKPDKKRPGRVPKNKKDVKAEIEKKDATAEDEDVKQDDSQIEEPQKITADVDKKPDGQKQLHEIDKPLTDVLNEAHKMAPKKTKKQRKNQIVGFNTIKLITMMMHHQKKDLNMKLTPDEIIEKHVPLNYQRQLDLCFQSYYKVAPGEMERVRSLNPMEINDPNNNQSRTIKLQKKIRRIIQDVKINNETSELMFDFIKQKDPGLDEYEQRHLDRAGQADKKKISEIEKQNLLLKEKTLKREKQLQQLNKEFEQMKNRQFQVRRGRNNRIFYKSMAKTVFDYDSDDFTMIDDSNKQWNHDNRECGRKRQKHPDVSCSKNLDRIMMNQKALIEDIQKHCKNKRLKKNILKMGGIRLMSNGTKQSIEQPQYTNASSDFEKMPRTVNDPVIENVFKKTHREQYNEIMAAQANEALIRKGVIPENLFENESIHQKLDDYEEFIQSRKTQVCTPTNSEQKRQQAEYSYKKQKIDAYGNMYDGFNGAMDPQQQFANGMNSFNGTTLAASPSNTAIGETVDPQDPFKLSQHERESILQNLHFQKTFNKSVSVYKQQMSSDFLHFKQHVKQLREYQQQLYQPNNQQLFAFNQQQQYIQSDQRN